MNRPARVAAALTVFFSVLHTAAAGATTRATASASVRAALVAPSTATAERPVRTIEVFINGERLQTETPPQVVGGRVYLPLRAIFAALGIGVWESSSGFTAALPEGSVVFRLNSDVILVNGTPQRLDGPVIRRGAVLYVPLRVLTAAVGAVVSYDQAGARLEIVSGYIGKNIGPEQPSQDGGSTVTGVVSAIDLNSAPPSVTVIAAGISRTISITSGALVYVEDATVHSQTAATLADVHVGDALRAVLTRDGRVVEVHDFYKSTSGTIAAVSPSAFVLQNGRVITPSRSTTITLNTAPATLDDLKVGDYVSVRSNPESGELREIIASRPSLQTKAPATTVTITAFSISATHPLRAGDSFTVQLVGTPGGTATFDVGDDVVGIPMHEQTPGTYVGQMTIPDRFNVLQIPVYGHLDVNGNDAPRATAPTQLSASTTPPQVTEVAPPPGQTVNNTRPSIYATFVSPGDLDINSSSITLLVNGHDVTASATRAGTFITYSPGVDLPQGEIHVTVRVADAAGNVGERSWSFIVQAP
ncbi:MAG TPA: stalk domain-containing protein [Candidatus Acidoferrales bacterium]|nr:stalk domain-containing protein [Candidatus Acidoferrales bacterium]